MTPEAPLPSTEALKATGAHRFDPVRFGYIEALQRRSEQQRDSVRHVLEEKKRAALRAYVADLEKASATARAQVNDIRETFPETVEQAQAMLDELSFGQLGKLAKRLRESKVSPAKGLAAILSGQRGGQVANPELESTRQFRDSLARRKANRLVRKSALEAPAEPGPLNPQMLALRSLEVMGELSPAYLHRFVNYIETLLWLQQAGDRNS